MHGRRKKRIRGNFFMGLFICTNTNEINPGFPRNNGNSENKVRNFLSRRAKYP
jgi:hypothetical protein